MLAVLGMMGAHVRMTLTSVLSHHVRTAVSALSRGRMAVLLRGATHAFAVLGMMGAHVRMTLTSVLSHHVRTAVFALSRERMAVLLRGATHALAVLATKGLTASPILMTACRIRARTGVYARTRWAHMSVLAWLATRVWRTARRLWMYAPARKTTVTTCAQTVFMTVQESIAATAILDTKAQMAE